jgi:hypothetical protein
MLRFLWSIARAIILPIFGRLDVRDGHGADQILSDLVIPSLMITTGFVIGRINWVASTNPHPIRGERRFTAKLQTVLAVSDEHGRKPARAIVGITLGVGIAVDVANVTLIEYAAAAAPSVDALHGVEAAPVVDESATARELGAAVSSCSSGCRGSTTPGRGILAPASAISRVAVVAGRFTAAGKRPQPHREQEPVHARAANR